MQELPSSLVNVMATVNVPSIGLSYRIKWVFPIGAALSVAGIVLNAVLDFPGSERLPEWAFITVSRAFLPMMLVGTAFLIVGAYLDRQRLAARQAKVRGILCWVLSAACFVLLRSFDSVHAWSFALMFPAFAGLIGGIILLP